MMPARILPLLRSIACQPKEMRVASCLRWTLLVVGPHPVPRHITRPLVRCLSLPSRKKTRRILDSVIALARRSRLQRPRMAMQRRRSLNPLRNLRRRPQPHLPSQLPPLKPKPMVEDPGFLGNGARRRSLQPQAQSKPNWERRAHSIMTRSSSVGSTRRPERLALRLLRYRRHHRELLPGLKLPLPAKWHQQRPPHFRVARPLLPVHSPLRWHQLRRSNR